jgi:histidinol-phosphate aminotransferase
MSWRTNIRDEIRSMTPRQRRPSGAVWLDANESPYGLDEQASAALAQHLARVPLHRYPEASADALERLVAEQLGVDPAGVLVGNGTEELVRLLCSTFSKLKPRESRPRVGYPVPGPAPYRPAVLGQGARSLEMPLREDFGLDLVAMERHITGGHPNLLLFCRPNDPTGNLWPRAEMEAVIDDHPEIVVAVDETYHEYCGETLLDLMPKHPHLVILRSLSRIGLAGLRVGFLIGQPDLVAEVQKVRPAHNMGTLSLEAALWLLQNQRPQLLAQVEKIKVERERLAGALTALEGVKVWPSLGNFLMIQVADGPGVRRALLSRNVVVAEAGESALTANCLRVSVGAPAENDALVAALPEAIAHPEPAPAPSLHKETELNADEDPAKPSPGLPRFL